MVRSHDQTLMFKFSCSQPTINKADSSIRSRSRPIWPGSHQFSVQGYYKDNVFMCAFECMELICLHIDLLFAKLAFHTNICAWVQGLALHWHHYCLGSKLWACHSQACPTALFVVTNWNLSMCTLARCRKANLKRCFACAANAWLSKFGCVARCQVVNGCKGEFALDVL